MSASDSQPSFSELTEGYRTFGFTLLIIAFLTTFWRLRIRAFKHWWWDDFVCVIALVLHRGFNVLVERYPQDASGLGSGYGNGIGNKGAPSVGFDEYKKKWEVKYGAGLVPAIEDRWPWGLDDMCSILFHSVYLSTHLSVLLMVFRLSTTTPSTSSAQPRTRARSLLLFVLSSAAFASMYYAIGYWINYMCFGNPIWEDNLVQPVCPLGTRFGEVRRWLNNATDLLLALSPHLLVYSADLTTKQKATTLSLLGVVLLNAAVSLNDIKFVLGHERCWIDATKGALLEFIAANVSVVHQRGG